MTAAIVGAAMLVAPFVAFAIFLWRVEGVRAVIFIYGGTALVVTWLIAACCLIAMGLKP